MLLRQDGETCTVGFHDVIDRWYKAFSRYTKLDKEDRVVIHDCISWMYDDYLTNMMEWTKNRWVRPVEDYIERLGDIVEHHPNPKLVIEDTRDYICNQLNEYLELPTWMIVHVRFRNGYIHLEMGEDYRIQFFMEKHAHEYKQTRRRN